MNISRQIGWGTESNLLYQILKQITRLTSIMFSLKPNYKVFTALVSQVGTSSPHVLYIGTGYGNTLAIGTTYTIEENANNTDFTVVGAPNNNVGTSFIATGTTPANQSSGDNTYLSYDDGAPIVAILENTIGNVWFTYNTVGKYFINSNSLFTLNKTFIDGASLAAFPVFNRIINEDGTGFGVQRGYLFQQIVDTEIRLTTISDDGILADDVISNPICIEIRVYN